MPAGAARKSSKPPGPTWTKIEGGKSGQPRTRSASSKSSARPQNYSGGGKPRQFQPKQRRPPLELPSHLRREMVGLLLLVLAALSAVGLYAWLGGNTGVVAVMGGVLAELFGVVAWLVPVSVGLGAILLLVGAKAGSRWTSPLVPLGVTLMLLGAMGFLHLFAEGQRAADAGQGGGYLGLAISTLLSDYLTRVGAGVVLLAVGLLGFMLAFGVSLGQFIRGVGKPTLSAGRFAGRTLGRAGSHVSQLLRARSVGGSGRPGPVRINGQLAFDEEAMPAQAEADQDDEQNPAIPALPTHHLENEPAHVVVLPAEATATEKAKAEPVINKLRAKSAAGAPDTAPQIQTASPFGYVWNLPPLNTLDTLGEVKVSQVDIKAKIKVIEETLASFNVEATVREVNTGPAVTQFAIEPGVGVRVSRVTSLDKDLALALAAPDIRIEAPIPGQSRIGVEVPNASLQIVGLRGLMESEVYAGSKARLKVCLGRDTHGHPVVTDLAKLPHLLVAGATGSGKSIFLNSMVIGFLLQFTPDDLRMLMIDPKRVELSGFNGIPHLLRPVVTDVRMDKDAQAKSRASGGQTDRERPLTAVEALKWALWEMERRYKLFAKGQKAKDGISKVFRNIEQYRTFMRESPDIKMEHLPYIVIIIDELADLMLTAPEEVETSLCRLAQLARATGIHLVVATQRPSVDVVTGLIKANFPARSAFAVTSQVDSKVILDGPGAEKLLGRGDMLYTASDESKPVRIQGTFVSDAESDRIVNFWRKQLPSPEAIDTPPEAQGVVQPMPMPEWLGTGDANEDSELLEQAIDHVKRNRYVSVSMLQRKLRVGYNRAARLVEQMEEMGLISAANSENKGKPREVLIGAPDNRGLDVDDHPDEEEL
ncbi:MAG: segregation ATPase FtsK/SpoIIIE, family [Chloroflexia bacterium]|nr:segregation ATPase FtsK/SpoIIIE, family [Chloroflexia bacterium]